HQQKSQQRRGLVMVAALGKQKPLERPRPRQRTGHRRCHAQLHQERDENQLVVVHAFTLSRRCIPPWLRASILMLSLVGTEGYELRPAHHWHKINGALQAAEKLD